jgi:hypothetical protein
VRYGLILFKLIDMKNQFTLALVFVVLFAIILLYSNEKEHDDWDQKVAHYQRISDSLRYAIDEIHVNVKAKDSLILLYMASLDRTLEELNKEAKKNATVISDNAQIQDSLISTYCRDMAKLNQRPDVCQ